MAQFEAWKAAHADQLASLADDDVRFDTGRAEGGTFVRVHVADDHAAAFAVDSAVPADGWVELDTWRLVMRDGNTITVYAHSYSEEEGEYRFWSISPGPPVVEAPVARVPASLVERIEYMDGIQDSG